MAFTHWTQTQGGTGAASQAAPKDARVPPPHGAGPSAPRAPQCGAPAPRARRGGGSGTRTRGRPARAAQARCRWGPRARRGLDSHQRLRPCAGRPRVHAGCEGGALPARGGARSGGMWRAWRRRRSPCAGREAAPRRAPPARPRRDRGCAGWALRGVSGAPAVTAPRGAVPGAEAALWAGGAGALRGGAPRRVPCGLRGARRGDVGDMPWRDDERSGRRLRGHSCASGAVRGGSAAPGEAPERRRYGWGRALDEHQVHAREERGPSVPERLQCLWLLGRGGGRGLPQV